MHLVTRVMTLSLLTALLRTGVTQTVRIAAFNMRNAVVVLVLLPLIIAALFVSARDSDGDEGGGEDDREVR